MTGGSSPQFVPGRMKEFDVRAFGAQGVARPGEILELTNRLHPNGHDFAPGFRATIYEAAPGAEYDSIGIQQAIDAAGEAGGGTVIVPAGDYLIGPLELRSGVALHLEGGARLWGSPNLEDYDGPQGEAAPIYAAAHAMHGAHDKQRSAQRRLISASDAENVTITGSGQISGQSPKWFIPWYNQIPHDPENLRRPAYSIIFHRCRRVRIEGVRIVDTTAWSLVFNRCEQVQIRGIELHNMDIHNGDGIDLVDTSHVTISDCQIHTADDGIVLKSHHPERAVRNIAVTNCIIRTLCNGIKIGTESVGTFEDISVSNLVIQNQAKDVQAAGRGAWSGINLSSLDGGLVRNVNISNVVMRNVECAFFLLISCRETLQKPYRTPRAGTMERIFLSNIQVDGCRYTAYLAGLPGHPIRQAFLNDIHIRKTADFYKEKPAKPVEDSLQKYPHPFRFGSRAEGDQLPAHGLYLRHVDQISVHGFHVECTQLDARDLLVQEHCSAVETSRVSGRCSGGPA